MRVRFTLGAALLCTAAAWPALAQDVELFEQPRFAGMRLTLSQDLPDVAAYGLGGRVASVVVRRGQWEFCTAVNFGGACVTVGVGRYAELPPAFRGTLASVRNAAASMAAAQGGATQPFPVPGGAQPAPPLPASTEAVILYEGLDHSGYQLALSAAHTRLSNANFNDVAGSVEITRGRWQFCQHSDYAGECQVLGPGRHVFSGRLMRGVSSLRRVGGPNDQPLTTIGAITLFEHSDHQGRELFVAQATPNLGGQGFNDTVSSVDVLAGRWELCTDANFGGRCLLLAPGRHNLERALNDRITSVRPR